MADNILEVRNLKKHFKSKNGTLHAVDDVSFSVKRGETLGLVGESGCGKSTIGRLILGLHQATSGEILFNGQDICKMNKAQIHDLRKDLQIIFQDPFSSLNPRMSIGEIIGEPLYIHKKIKHRADLEAEVRRLMDVVGLSERLVNSYPHELDGGRRQRVGIARALSLTPQFIVCDEPVSSLDVSIQAQVLNLLKDLQAEYGLTYLFITHDLSVVKYFSDKIAVMYLGQLVEIAESDELFKKTIHPYSQALLSAIPVPNIRQKMQRVKLVGELTSPIDPEPGCRFAKRCLYSQAKCVGQDPALQDFGNSHFCACCRADELLHVTV
ncbi:MULTISPECIES: oligopeptide/dipeptide ABC transporter ATP-binding protein [Brevibacillus]|uniref:ABC transporter ATP-binding protein n=1 Tax=Brevibacillus TaxID=55080 RepID=UPI002865190A|nr:MULTISPECIES: oligopeptide/dipeptide ABC transporter ATP-binding protein [Brevibacillus]MDR7316423.1 peptide/nickel transport system ATP-binding protein [Brevibacillus nitrificans]MED1949588.1 ATP-binding cassette domain-containing protein [Brevibacillus centrosporus]